MAGPMMSAPVAAQQIAQQQVQDQGLKQTAKQGASKFDGVMAQKAQAAQAPAQIQNVQAAQHVQQTQNVQKTQAAQKVDHTRHVEQANRTDHVQNKALHVSAERAAPVDASRPAAASHLTGLLSDIEKGQGLMDKLINGGLSGKSFSNSELLALQAGMYKYTQELELTGKVVEKATTGLKDTLKTQV